MILILSSKEDGHVPLVTRELDKREASYLCFDPGDFPEHATVSFRLTTNGAARWILKLCEQEYNSTQITAVWDRRPNAPIPHAALQEPTIRDWVEVSSRHFLEGLWDSLNCLWIPAKPVRDREAHNKLRQLALANHLGFLVPETLVTNDPSAFIHFFSESHQSLVAKSLIQRPLEVSGHDVPAIYTRPVHRRNAARYMSIRRAPVVFQASVPKLLEIRATVIGKRVFAAEIHSQCHRSTLHDWRHYHDQRVLYAVHKLEADREAALIRLVDELGLCFGAVDLILTPSKEYVFLEINPNGQWGFIEILTGLPLAAAITDLLLSG